MGLSGSKTTTKVNQTENASTTPTNPQWVTDALQGFTNSIGQFGASDPYSYIAPTNQLLQSVFSQAGSGWGGQGVNLAQQVGSAGPNLAGSPSLVNGQTYGAPQLGAAQGYQAPTLGAAQRAAVQGYDPSMVGRVSIGSTPDAQATDATAQSLLTNLNRYMSPYTNDVVRTTLSGFDENAGQVRAQQAAAAARNKAFGGSRYGIQEAQTEAGLGRERAATEAGLRDRAFNVGAGLSADDANRRQQVSIGNADRRTGVSQFNAGSALQRALAQAGFDFQGNALNAGAANDSRSFLARGLNEAALAQSGYQNQRDIAGAGLAADARRFGADSSNQFRLSQAGLDQGASQFGAQSALQAALANQAATGRRDEFNAGQQDSALARQLQAAGLMGSEGRADLGMRGSLGLQQQALDQARAQAPQDQLALLAQLYGSTPFNLFTGQNVNSNLSGTNVTKQSTGLGQMLLNAGQAAAMAYASDRRLKTHIDKLGEFADGLGIYRFAYKAAPAVKFIGVMADEVAKLRPWALGPVSPDGFASVAYGRL